jgi:hypothetical protein
MAGVSLVSGRRVDSRVACIVNEKQVSGGLLRDKFFFNSFISNQNYSDSIS